jgi:hypothetical protein
MRTSYREREKRSEERDELCPLPNWIRILAILVGLLAGIAEIKLATFS